MYFFNTRLSFQIGNGDKMVLWTHIWVGDQNFATRFLHLFSIASNYEAKVVDYVEGVGGLGMAIVSVSVTQILKNAELYIDPCIHIHIHICTS